MRRSKSDPAKYVRNHRRISRRRMTDLEKDDGRDGGEEEEEEEEDRAEMERLRGVLRESEAKIRAADGGNRAAADGAEDAEDGGVEGETEGGLKKEKKKKRRREKSAEAGGGKPGDAADDGGGGGGGADDGRADRPRPVLSPELEAELGLGGGGALLLPSRRKKKKKSSSSAVPAVVLTPEEIRAARLERKNAARKLRQLSERSEKRRLRLGLYATLAECSISAEERELMRSSAELGKREGRRERLRRLVRRERAGLELTEEERGELYEERTVPAWDGGDDEGEGEAGAAVGGAAAGGAAPGDDVGTAGATNEEARGGDEEGGLPPAEEEAAPLPSGPRGKRSRRKKKRKREKGGDDNADAAGSSAGGGSEEARAELPDGGKDDGGDDGGTAEPFERADGEGGASSAGAGGAMSMEDGEEAPARSSRAERRKRRRAERKQRRLLEEEEEGRRLAEAGREAGAAGGGGDDDDGPAREPSSLPGGCESGARSDDGAEVGRVGGKEMDVDSDKGPQGNGGLRSEERADDDNKDDKEAAAAPAGDAPMSAPAAAASGASLAADMMAGLSTLKTKAAEGSADCRKREAALRAAAEEERRREEEADRRSRTRYVPGEEARVKTAGRARQERAGGVLPEDDDDAEGGAGAGGKKAKTNWRVLPVDRPPDVAESRYDLPVSAMEYEIVDAVRIHDVTVICGETGSGKSTQVPQFLYESGITLGLAEVEGQDDGLLIGVTQPRRVAAVSTARRVRYEMGRSGDNRRGGKGNLVSYQTRYESSGTGSETRIKFMTDGILLREMRSDLLLRRYGAVVIDEAHERNLNTDVLLGMLSRALPLRRRAAREGSLPPLKVVVMSATLRVDDFARNDALFPPDKGEGEGRPAVTVVAVPGRAHPVTVHHSKVTELDDYETVAFDKVCKIHRRLPRGGILVFLTGKREIARMVRRLERALGRRKRKRSGRGGDSVEMEGASPPSDETPRDGDGGPRGLDDDEMDGDLFEEGEEDDDYGATDAGADADEEEEIDREKGGDAAPAAAAANSPADVRVLPLHSMLPVHEQARVFAPVPEGARLIVVATNVAETSLTIPGISYVVDAGRRKVRSYHHPGTGGGGVSSYDVTWISRASADQRAGRAGRTGPGRCYRLYSSAVYARQFRGFDPPEVSTRPLEDVVLAVKAAGVRNVASFPFPTPPDRGRVDAALGLLADLGCLDASESGGGGKGGDDNGEGEGSGDDGDGDGRVTELGSAAADLPVGARHGKMLLVAAGAGVLDHALSCVAVLSEGTGPFVRPGEGLGDGEEGGGGAEDNAGERRAMDEDLAGLDDVDRNAVAERREKARREKRSKWAHRGGDVMAGMVAAGAYAYAGRGAGGMSEAAARQKFCGDNGLSGAAMQRIHKMRQHLARLAKIRLGDASGVASTTGCVLSSMAPPTRKQESLLMQAICSGLLDHVARRATPEMLPHGRKHYSRAVYMSSNMSMKEPLYIDSRSALFSKESSRLPEWVCYDSVVRKPTKDGTTVAVMKIVTPLEPSWLPSIAKGSRLLTLGAPLDAPLPTYDKDRDSIMCYVSTKFGSRGWVVPPSQVEMRKAVDFPSKSNSTMVHGDSFRWFARFLLEGKIISDLTGLRPMLNDDPAIITGRKPVSKVALLVSSLSGAGIDSASALRRHWAEKDSKFLFKLLKLWARKDCAEEVRRLWKDTVKRCIAQGHSM